MRKTWMEVLQYIISLIVMLSIFVGCTETMTILEGLTEGDEQAEENQMGSLDSDHEMDDSDVIDSEVTGSKVMEGYYAETFGLYGLGLKIVLNDIITEGHGALTYDQVYSALEETDEDPDDPSNVILFYKNVSVGGNELRMSDDGDIWNREHIWAKSHGDFGTKRGPGTDLHMIRPTDASINARRGHLDFDYSDQPFSEAPDTYVDKDSFEPRDEVKGDVARMLFYMAVRYEGEDGEVDLELTNSIDTFFATETGYGEHGKLDTLIEWHYLDPVDDQERRRNETVHAIQGNRNPFIDHPEFVHLVWNLKELNR